MDSFCVFQKCAVIILLSLLFPMLISLLMKYFLLLFNSFNLTTKVARGHAPSSRGKSPALMTTLKLSDHFNVLYISRPLSFLNVGLYSLNDRRLKSSPTLLTTQYLIYLSVCHKEKTKIWSLPLKVFIFLYLGPSFLLSVFYFEQHLFFYPLPSRQISQKWFVDVIAIFYFSSRCQYNSYYQWSNR